MQVCIPGLHISHGIFNCIWSLFGGALTELDLKLARLESGDKTPTGSSTYDHFSSLLQRIALKQVEVDTQHGYVMLVDEMVTHSTLTLPNAQGSCLSSCTKNQPLHTKFLTKWYNTKISHLLYVLTQ